MSQDLIEFHIYATYRIHKIIVAFRKLLAIDLANSFISPWNIYILAKFVYSEFFIYLPNCFLSPYFACFFDMAAIL